MKGIVVHGAFAGPPVRHGFTTRAARDDWEALARAAGFHELRTLSQVHGRAVVRAEDVESGAAADAVITDRPGLLLGVQSADCVPVLLWDERRGAVGAVHAGWRGTAAGVTAAALRAMRDRYGTRAADVQALIGPAIGPCCYEVGDEVREALERVAPGAGAPAGRGANGGATVDLWRANRLGLEAAGVEPERILLVAQCTRCRADLYPSFRREGPGCGRILSFIGIAGS